MSGVAASASLLAFPAFFLPPVAVDSKGARKKGKLTWPLPSLEPEIKPWEVKCDVLLSFPLWRHEKN